MVHDVLHDWVSYSVVDSLLDILQDVLHDWVSYSVFVSVLGILHDLQHDVQQDVLSVSVRDLEQSLDEQVVLQSSVFVSVRDVEQSWAAQSTEQDRDPHDTKHDCVDVLIMLVLDVDVHDCVEPPL